MDRKTSLDPRQFAGFTRPAAGDILIGAQVVAIFIGGSTAVALARRMWDGVGLEYEPAITSLASLFILVTIAAFVMVAVLQPPALATAGSAESRRRS